MEMCPFCGEDVPAESKRCWKCGTELSAEGGADSGVPIQQGKKPADAPQLVCPFCQASLSPRALRCNECGRAVPSRSERRRAPAIYTSFAVVLLATLGWLVYALASKPRAEETRVFVPAKTYHQLIRMYEAPSAKAEKRRRELWEAYHRGKYVKWEGTVLEVREDQTLTLGKLGTDPEHPDAVLALEDPEEIKARKLSRGKPIRYSALLDRYEGRTIYLSRGVLED